MIKKIKKADLGKDNKIIKGEELIIPILFLLFSLIYLAQVWQEAYIVVLWPFIVMALLLGSIIFLLIKLFVEQTEPKAKPKKMLANIILWLSDNRKPLFIVLFTILYLSFLPYLGFSLSNFLYLMVLFWVLGTHQFLSNISLAAAISAILHLIMIEFLQMTIPRLSLPLVNWQI